MDWNFVVGDRVSIKGFEDEFEAIVRQNQSNKGIQIEITKCPPYAVNARVHNLYWFYKWSPLDNSFINSLITVEKVKEYVPASSMELDLLFA